MVTVALAGEPSTAPPAEARATVKALEPENAVVLMATTIAFGALSPSAQVKVPEVVE
jgi:hypothetical protein